MNDGRDNPPTPPKENAVKGFLKKWKWWIIGGFSVYMIYNTPRGAAGLVHSATAHISTAADRLSAFVSALS